MYIFAAKRAVDQEKLRDLDRLRLEVETLNEFRTKVLESQASLQKELKRVSFSGIGKHKKVRISFDFGKFEYYFRLKMKLGKPSKLKKDMLKKCLNFRRQLKWQL
jgi:hypothetical protein